MIYRLTIDCFHATAEVAEALELFRKERLFSKSRIQLSPGGMAAAIEHYRNNATPQVVIVEEPEDEATLLDRLRQLAEVCVAGTRVLVIGRVNDIGLYRKLLAQGVSEYLTAPSTASQIVSTITGLYSDPSTVPTGRLIAFYGARGGVGSSTLAHNAAWALADATGEEVMLIDLDLAFGTVGLAFNVEARQTVGELLGEPERIDAQLIERILVKYDERLQLLPSPSLLKPWPPVDPEALDRLLDLGRRMAPFVVLDLPHLWAPWVDHAVEAADELVIVAQPDLANLRETKALLDELGGRRGDKASTHVVLNKVDAFKKTQLTLKDFEESLKLKPALSFVFDPIFGQASNNGQMLGQAAKNHKMAEAVKQLALLVGRRQGATKAKKAPTKDLLSSWLVKAKRAR